MTSLVEIEHTSVKICCANLIFILVRPLFLGNIGSAARVLKNFGFTRVRLVEPPKNYKDAEARKMSVGAFDVLKNCEVFSTLSDALKDVSLAVGTTSGQSRAERPEPLLSVTARAVRASQKELVAFVFGDERDGLTRAELTRCHHVTTVPTNPDFPALNVAQAVGVIAYELTRTELEQAKLPDRTHSLGRVDDELFAELDQMLDVAQFTRKYNRHVILQELRSLYQRMHPTEREADIISGIVRRLNQHLSEKSRSEL